MTGQVLGFGAGENFLAPRLQFFVNLGKESTGAHTSYRQKADVGRGGRTRLRCVRAAPCHTGAKCTAEGRGAIQFSTEA